MQPTIDNKDNYFVEILDRAHYSCVDHLRNRF